MPCWCYLWLYLSSTHWSHSSSPGLGTWRSSRLHDSTYMSLLPGISCCLLLCFWPDVWVLSDTGCVWVVVRGIGSCGGEFLFSKGSCTLFSSWPFVFHELLGCYSSAWGWGMVSLPAGHIPWWTLGYWPLPRKGREVERGLRSCLLKCLEFTRPNPQCPSALPPLRSPHSQPAAC